MTLLALALAFAGLTALCLAMDRHYGQIWDRVPTMPTVRLFRLGGTTLLGASWTGCACGWGWAIGSVVWLGLLSAAGLALSFMLPFAPRRAGALAIVSPIVAALIAGIDL